MSCRITSRLFFVRRSRDIDTAANPGHSDIIWKNRLQRRAPMFVEGFKFASVSLNVVCVCILEFCL